MNRYPEQDSINTALDEALKDLSDDSLIEIIKQFNTNPVREPQRLIKIFFQDLLTHKRYRQL